MTNEATGSVYPEKRKGEETGKYVARWRIPGQRKQPSKVFGAERDANRFLRDTLNKINNGTYVDRKRSTVTVADWAETWFRTKAHLAETTRTRYRGVLDGHVIPRWGDYALHAVSHAELQEWLSNLQRLDSEPGSPVALGAGSLHYLRTVLRQLFDLAVRDQRLAVSPAVGLRVPRIFKPSKRYLTVKQVHALAAAAEQYPNPEIGQDRGYRTLVYVLSFCGLRWSEMAALRVSRVNLLRRRLVVEEVMVESKGRAVWKEPKSHAVRDVPVAPWLAALLADLVAGKGPGDLVFTTRSGSVLRNGNFRDDVLDRAAVDAAIPGLTPHELRHTAASLFAAGGADPKTLQKMMGHESFKLTYDTYAELYDDGIDVLGDAMQQFAPEASPVAIPGRVVRNLCADGQSQPIERIGEAV